MKIYLACDHAGLVTKELVKEYLQMYKEEGQYKYEVIDFGANIYNEADDYPDFIHEAGKALSQDNQNLSTENYLNIQSFAFVFGGSGTGEVIVMNRYKGVRCLEIYNNLDCDNIKEVITLSRQHNNANSISFGARFVNVLDIKNIIDIFISTQFAGDRHINRINKIEQTL